MFDLRYHVASLAAVFLALIIGILVGVGISGKGFVSDSERSLLNERIADLNHRLDSATKRGNELAKAQRAADAAGAPALPAGWPPERHEPSLAVGSSPHPWLDRPLRKLAGWRLGSEPALTR